MKRSAVVSAVPLALLVSIINLPANVEAQDPPYINLRLQRTAGTNVTSSNVLGGNGVYNDWGFFDNHWTADDIDAISWIGTMFDSVLGDQFSSMCKHRAMCLTPVNTWSLAPQLLAESWTINEAIKTSTGARGPQAEFFDVQQADGGATSTSTFRVDANPNYPGQVQGAELHVRFTITAYANEVIPALSAPGSVGAFGATWSASAGRSNLQGVYVGSGVWQVTGSIANGNNDVPVDIETASLIIDAWEPITVGTSVDASANASVGPWNSPAGIFGTPTPGVAYQDYFAEPHLILSVRVPN